jgi:hypothetical protein
VPALSEWLRLMLAEIAAKRAGAERARAEEAQRELEGATDRGGAGDAMSAAANEESAPIVEQPTRAEEDSAARAARR